MDLLTNSEALLHCQQLSNRIDESIKNNAGWISFATFMQHALYDSELGYYNGGALKFGENGDFITAPEISPLFGATLAMTIAPVIDYLSQGSGQATILEFGAGSGKLCQDILTQLHQIQSLPQKYLILELSPNLIARQKERLLPFLTSKNIPVSIEWVTQMPEAMKGVVLANEVLDAIPVDLIIKHQEEWFEWGVTIHSKPPSPSFSDHWQFKRGAKIRPENLPRYIQENPMLFSDGYITEHHVQAQAWIKHIASAFEQGVFLTLDYGFPEKEYYHPQRTEGTHIAHHRHQAIPDMFYLPGLCDLTTHVEWTSLNQIACAHHLSLVYYQSQGAYLLSAGIGDLFIASVDASDPIASIKASHALQKLISEAEMGELFKVIAWSANRSNDPNFDGLCATLPGFTGRQRPLQS